MKEIYKIICNKKYSIVFQENNEETQVNNLNKKQLVEIMNQYDLSFKNLVLIYKNTKEEIYIPKQLLNKQKAT